MSVQRSAGAIFWGLTLVAIGGLLLAHNLGYTIHVWSYVVRYWPALLIGWGLLKFVDYFRFRHAGDNRPLFSGGEVALLILVIIAGSAITTAANVSPAIGNIFEIGDFDLWDITGNNYSYEEHREQDNVPPGSEIEIVNLYGNVEVRSSDDTSRITVDVKKTIRASDKAEADRLDRDFTFSVQRDGSKYRVISNREDGFGNRGFPRQRFKSSLTLLVPKRSIIRLDNRNGRVVVQGLTGNQNVVNRYGDVEIRNIEGELSLENRNGGITVEDIRGAVVINNRYSNTTVKNIGGDLEIHTRNGSVDVSEIKGNAMIDNSYAPISVENVQGNLTINGRNNSVDLRHIEGDIRSDSSYQNVNIEDARGAVTVTSRNGDLRLALIKPPVKDISVTARYGNVTIALPSGSSFGVDARTEYGQVSSDFLQAEQGPGLQMSRSNRERSLIGRFGQGGPQISVTLRNGNISLEKRG
jgi:hypothetical protein